ncbi:DUF368 domain-containing protein [Candidatus Woesearchaeota archaeon]|jgi:putative membrane protein|nr:DUF368 domain-containing protein [Candidatus Woesearchaeota archaeon]
MKDKILLFLKGILMGICDLVPGISGGTIAFITGIYERLINAVKGFSIDTLLKRKFKRLDLGFLIVLLLGIFTALILGSGIIKFLLENYFVYTMAFFIGLIVASSFIIFEHIKNHGFKDILFGILGFILGISLTFLIPVEVNPTYPYIFLGGFVGISAMFLPGISGAFILLILGIYEFMINVLHNITNNLDYLFVFGLGAILGAFFISRLISYLFKKDRCKTLYFLLGLVLGALSIPIKRVFEYSEEFDFISLIVMLGLFLIGIYLVLLVRKYGSSYRDKLEDIEEKVFD